MTVNFDPLRASAITQGEFASLLKVSRVAVNGWVNGTMGVHPMRKPRVARLLKAIQAASRAGEFPLPPMPRDKRLSAIKRVLVTYLKQGD